MTEPIRRPRIHKVAALRHARLGLLAADQTTKTHTDPVCRADAATSRADWHAALAALRAPSKRRR